MSPKAYEVHLEVFEGPLDLLLHLIKKDDLDIGNIPIADITKEYLAYLELMKDLNLEVAGDFLVMAATLMQIKVKSLLPFQAALTEDGGPDPRAELVERLLEYQKFKEAACFLDDRGQEFRDIYYRGVPNFAEREKSLDIRVFDLLSTLREIMDRVGAEGGVVSAEEQRIEEKIEKILALLEAHEYVRLVDIFVGEKTRRGVITCFMALLEVVKLQKAFARQEAPFADILIYKKVEPVLPVWPSDPIGNIEGPGADAVGASDPIGNIEGPGTSLRSWENAGEAQEAPVQKEESAEAKWESEDRAEAERLIRENLGEIKEE